MQHPGLYLVHISERFNMFLITLQMEPDFSSVPDGIHFLEAAARSANGIWSHITKGIFFSYSNVPLNIKALEYYFEDEAGATGPLFSVSNFTPLPEWQEYCCRSGLNIILLY